MLQVTVPPDTKALDMVVPDTVVWVLDTGVLDTVFPDTVPKRVARRRRTDGIM